MTTTVVAIVLAEIVALPLAWKWELGVARAAAALVVLGALSGTVVAVVRTGLASLAGERSRQMTTISLDLARTVLIGLDLLLVSAALEAAIYAREPDFVRLGTVAIPTPAEERLRRAVDEYWSVDA